MRGFGLSGDLCGTVVVAVVRCGSGFADIVGTGLFPPPGAFAVGTEGPFGPAGFSILFTALDAELSAATPIARVSLCASFPASGATISVGNAITCSALVSGGATAASIGLSAPSHAAPNTSETTNSDASENPIQAVLLRVLRGRVAMFNELGSMARAGSSVTDKAVGAVTEGIWARSGASIGAGRPIASRNARATSAAD